MEIYLKEKLNTSLFTAVGHARGGCISQGQSYVTDRGRVFVKINHKPEARKMFDGEAASLEAILKTHTVKVPRPIKVANIPTDGAVLVMEHLDINPLSSYAAVLGEQLADLHLHNQKLGRKLWKERATIGKHRNNSEDVLFVDQFGFHVVTCCGYIPQVNEWQSDWVTFFTCQRLQPQMDLIEKDYGDREVQELWSQLQLMVPALFCDMEIVPALLHGDLWKGNVAEEPSGPVLFDPASFYGHSEFELAIGKMIGEYCETFYSAYHQKIPRAPGFKRRFKLYQLFHALNNWNHFGLAYRPLSLKLMRHLLNSL
ncbi:ketosamine-3-kinase-like isoform X1 [Microcaecilia unicolor]|uniref:protein-ribulosamine 3-kinase n=1 Tax=Microcaecilia unicolor TaxID=1415580 RepID=A0A6P7YIC9_9AMPH|nr:ketosamine-3-kinase-like isoform X1 [Microcaecilia unicolor]